MRCALAHPPAGLVRMRLPDFTRLARACLDLALAASASLGAVWLHYEGAPPHGWPEPLRALPILLALRAAALWQLGVFTGLWRYAGIAELARLATAIAASSAAFVAVTFVAGGSVAPPGLTVLDGLLTFILLGALRAIARRRHERSNGRSRRRVLVIGAGNAGEMIVRDMLRAPDSRYEPVGFVDDDPRKHGYRIHGVRVLGSRAAIDDIMRRTRPHQVLVAIPSASLAVLRDILHSLEPYKVPVKTLPSLRELPECRVVVSQIRDLALEDLLPRPVIDLDPAPVHAFVGGRRVLVTGAGGSIGSELCRQILRMNPASLVLVERHENALFWLRHELEGLAPGAPIVPAIGDIGDEARMGGLFETCRPDVIFHAAAHKHVPLMEENPCEAIKNNVFGTLTIARAAEAAGVDRFILISTDKAVNPTSVMGASKRVAEFVVQELMRDSPTTFAAVRFGNVLGSNGSVALRFMRQIEEGGPVTVTDPEMRRYFMLIPEAVSLVLHAAARARRGTVLVLEMGEQLKVVDLARQMIRLAGLVPDRDIQISFTGPRPGEKLAEELVEADETTRPCDSLLMEVTPGRLPSRAALVEGLSALERAVARDDAGAVIAELSRLVPTFRMPAPLAGNVPAGTGRGERLASIAAGGALVTPR